MLVIVNIYFLFWKLNIVYTLVDDPLLLNYMIKLNTIGDNTFIFILDCSCNEGPAGITRVYFICCYTIIINGHSSSEYWWALGGNYPWGASVCVGGEAERSESWRFQGSPELFQTAVHPTEQHLTRTVLNYSRQLHTRRNNTSGSPEQPPTTVHATEQHVIAY